jgi:hypothetical protein
LVVEEVRYDFEEFKKYADDFLYDLLKLMIISKMNSTYKNSSAREYFVSLVKQIEGCDAYIVKYGQSILYAKYRGMEFTDQKITTQFVRLNDHAIDVTMESVFGEFVKTFDNLASTSESKVKWGIKSENTTVDPLLGKRFGIKNVTITKQSATIEFLIDGNLNMIILNPAKKKRDERISLLGGSSDIARTLVSIMKQS